MIVYLEFADPDNFIRELRTRMIKEVRKATIREVLRGYANLQANFSAWDRPQGMILRMSVKYWTGPIAWINPPDEGIRKEIEKGYNDYVAPLEKKFQDSGLSIQEGQYLRD